MGSCLPCRPDNNPSETRTRFLPGLKNSCDKLSVLLGSTLYQKPMNILPAGGREGGGRGGRTSSPRRLLGSSDDASLGALRAPLAQTVCTHGCLNNRRQRQTSWGTLIQTPSKRPAVLVAVSLLFSSRMSF